MFSKLNYFLFAVIISIFFISTSPVFAAPIYPKVGSTLIYHCTGTFTGVRKNKIIDVHNGKIFTLTTGNPSTPVLTKRFLWQFLLPGISELRVFRTSLRSQKLISGDIDKLDYTQTGKTYRGVIEQVGETSSDNEKIDVEAVIGIKASHRMPDGSEVFGHLITVNRISDNRSRIEQTAVVSPETGNTIFSVIKVHGETLTETSCLLKVN
jgi:hypothetical protein